MPQSSYGCGDPNCRSCYEDLHCRHCRKVEEMVHVPGEIDDTYECPDCLAYAIFIRDRDELITAGTPYRLYPGGRLQLYEGDDA
jgi:hypothetical protein